jgi:hypothetical protein
MLLAVAAVAASLGTTPPPPVPPAGVPSIDQYIETIPTAGGATAVGLGAPRTRKLPQVAARLRDASDGVSQTLKAAAVSSLYGAPQQPPDARPLRSAEPRGESSALDAVTSSLDESTSRHGLILLVVLIGVVSAMLGAAALAKR